MTMFSINNYGSFQVHGGAGHESGLVQGLNDLLVFIDGLAGHSASEIFALLMPGVAGMVNLHPLVVHFPIALLTLFFIVELLAIIFKKENWQLLVSALLYMGTFCAAITVYLGFQAAETVAHDDLTHAIMERHEGYGVAILSLAALLSVWRMVAVKHKAIELKVLFLMLSGLLALLVVLGADLGGLMVYQHGVGVQMESTAVGSAGMSEANIVGQGNDQAGHNHSGHQHGHDHSAHHH